MIIQDEAALASLMGRALSVYANRVQNGQIKPFLALLKGERTITVNVTVNDDGSISVKEASVTPVLEAQPEIVINTSDVPETIEFLNSASDVAEVKPKRKRKRKQ
jgi:hypothetical protein